VAQEIATTTTTDKKTKDKKKKKRRKRCEVQRNKTSHLKRQKSTVGTFIPFTESTAT